MFQIYKLVMQHLLSIVRHGWNHHQVLSCLTTLNLHVASVIKHLNRKLITMNIDVPSVEKFVILVVHIVDIVQTKNGILNFI